MRRRHLCELLQGLDPRRLGAREGEDDGGGAIADGRAAEATPDVVEGDAPTPLSRVEPEHHVGRMEHTMGRVLFRIADQPLQKNVEP